MRSQSRQQFRSMYHAKVSNARNGVLIGYVGDISESGLKILSELPFVQEEHLQMLVQISEGNAAQFDLNATCKWSGNNLTNGYFEGGFCLNQPSIQFTSMVQELRRFNGAEKKDLFSA